ncbi:tyrosine/serine/threonine protein phosphatase PPS1 [Sugiyamaella lignohabitans]|uniref:Tyrosine/serine/threonine protein phosphatase PPS1 n=1 Tax=Sugiyamaella lignohabitans TaxID=796027 RepID=A0A167FPQ3_9ASCO|nr:tyrosine/serine/threonine protein phosphatase PPS1 [Sugiyamaella lignohabitans]ANB15545.1 tyrosine/serine/threonine protein phosphatase PPS1 [Sugiyamaella lignohabitans]
MAFMGVAVAPATTPGSDPEELASAGEICPPASAPAGGISLKLNKHLRQSRRAKRSATAASGPVTRSSSLSGSSVPGSAGGQRDNEPDMDIQPKLHIKAMRINPAKQMRYQSDLGAGAVIASVSGSALGSGRGAGGGAGAGAGSGSGSNVASSSPSSSSSRASSHSRTRSQSHTRSSSNPIIRDNGATAHLNIPLPPIPTAHTDNIVNLLTPPSGNGFKSIDPLVIPPAKSTPATPPMSPTKETAEHIEDQSLDISTAPSTVTSGKSISPSQSPPQSESHTPPPPLAPLENPLNTAQTACESATSRIPLISARTLASAIDDHYSKHLPEVDSVFPWMHGLHPKNLCQRAFLDPLKRYRDSSGVYFDLSRVNEDLLDDSSIFLTPNDVHGLMIVKVGDENNYYGTLVGTVGIDEILARRDGLGEDELDEWRLGTVPAATVNATATATASATESATATACASVSESESTNATATASATATVIASTTASGDTSTTASAIVSEETLNSAGEMDIVDADAASSTPVAVPVEVTNAAKDAVNYAKQMRKQSFNGDTTTVKDSSDNSADADFVMVDESDTDSPDNYCPYIGKFLCLDPPEGISLRNFQIQVAKWATLSNICIYAPDPKDRGYARKLALLVNQAQRDFHQSNPHISMYKTFVCDATVDEMLKIAPHTVSIPPQLLVVDEEEVRLKNWDSNFLFHERVEMSMMSSASPIACDVTNTNLSGGVWLGNTVDFETYIDMCQSPIETSVIDESIRTRNWATFIECFEGPQLPPFQVIDQYIKEAETIIAYTENKTRPTTSLTPLSIQFPSSGSIPLSECNDDVFFAIVSLCKLMYLRSKVPHRDGQAGVLIYCNDGYTETSLLALAYTIYATGVSSSQAWIDLHVKYSRPFFCFTVDVLVIMALERVLLEYSPAIPTSRYYNNNGAVYKQPSIGNSLQISNEMPAWFVKLDGSLPSKILPHMYLGSLHHAENPEMLVQLGIKRILSVGESLTWMCYENEMPRTSESSGFIYDKPSEGLSKVMYMDNIQDDGVDALTNSLAACLQFIDEGYKAGEPTLVHCRVGVSRSATVCIAEVMKRLSVGLPRAYLFVRVRRLNVIIQPNLRFMYELVKWEEMNRQNGEGWLREVDWHILCREISIINKVYIS